MKACFTDKGMNHDKIILAEDDDEIIYIYIYVNDYIELK